jgi:mono/diheme cytochrome c family protein
MKEIDMTRAILGLGLILLIGPVATLRAQGPAEPPAGTLADTAAGRQLYHGVGGCQSCHGEAGIGTPEAPPLVSGTWELGDGTYGWLLHMTRHAGWGMRGRGDEPRPMRGPTVLDSAQVRQVTTYVWAISRERRPASEQKKP